MTANEARIAEIVATPPIVRSRRARILDWTRNIAAVVAFLALALGLLNTQTSQTNSCHDSNRVRAQVADLWQYLIDQNRLSNPHPTPKQRADLAAFEKRVDQTYAPRKC